MRQYRNTITGVTIFVDSEIHGNWEEVVENPSPVPEEKPKKAKNPVKRTAKKKASE